MMTDFNPEARALMQAGRGALRATTADRDRIAVALRDRLGSDALPHDSAVAHGSSSRSWQAVVGVAGGICAVGGLAIFALQPVASVAVPRTRSAAPQTQTSSSDVPPTAAAGAPVPGEVSALSEKPANGMIPRVRDRLAREVSLLSRATRELRAGHPAAALKTLAEYKRSFPNGTLREECSAAEAQALCLLGRVREGRAELAQLVPGSPAAARAAQLCAPKASAAGDRK